MPDRYPKDSVLVPQWKRVEDGLPERMQQVTYAMRIHGTGTRVAQHGYYPGYWDTVLGLVTHWSPRVGIPLPEEE